VVGEDQMMLRRVEVKTEQGVEIVSVRAANILAALAMVEIGRDIIPIRRCLTKVDSDRAGP
jgi:hypothetical protein